jgi:DNA topoisomerase VI subunit A
MWQQGPLLRKLKDALDVSVYALVDGNPSGILIYLTYRFGSENRAYDSLLLTLPDIKLLGVFPCEVKAKWKGKGVARLKRLTGRDRRARICDSFLWVNPRRVAI